MARDNVTFKFRIDLTQMTIKGREAIKILEEIQRKSGQAATNMTQLGTASAKTGQQTAASAVNFQTATQGMLNLSTAAVQTFTSISNLDRANNRAKQSVIAVARAEDLLNNKTERLTQLQKAGTASGQQLANMQREIATATADLTVKQEKQGIEQDAVNDIYMLFATNIANVTISSMQTLSILDKNDILLKKGRVIAQKLVTFSTWENVRASRAKQVVDIQAIRSTAISTLGYKGQAFAIKGATFAQRMSTMATRAGTVALTGLKIALGPIGLIFIGISAAMAAYEHNLGGVKDTINGLLGVQDDFEQGLLDSRDATDDLINSTSDMRNEIGKIPDTYDKARKEMIKYRNELLNIADNQKLVSDSADILESKIPRSLSGFERGPAPKTGFNEFLKFLSKFGTLPTASAEPFIPENEIEVLQKFGIIPDLTFKDIGGFKHLTKLTTQDKEGREINIQDLAFGFAHREALTESTEFRRRSFAAEEREKQQNQRVREISKFGVASMIGTDLLLTGDRSKFDPARGEFLISNKPDPKLSKILGRDISAYDAGFLYRKSLKGEIDLTREERRVVKTIRDDLGLLDEDEGVDESNRLAKLDNREFIKQALHTDIGAVANVVDRNEALRLAVLQKQLTGFNRTSADPFVSDFSRLSLSERDRARSLGNVGVEHKFGFAADVGLQTSRVSDVFRGSMRAQQFSVKQIAGIGGRTDEILDILDQQAKGFRRDVLFNELGIVSGGLLGAGKSNFGRGFFKSTGATAAYQVPRGSIKTSAENRKRLDIRDANTNLLRFGGRLREGMTIEEEGAVVGGYSSVREFSRAARNARERGWTEGKALAASFGQVMPSGYLSGQGWKSESSRLANAASEMKSALSSAGLSFKNVGYLDMGYRWTAQQANRAAAQHSAAVAYNNNQYAKATQINILEGGFDLSGFRGTSMDLPSLQDKVLQQDDLMKSIGLTRTEAFQIIDTQGRGREEIDDRLKWKSRLNSISTGTAVL
jgi:hypothetical protein